jgi:hypothetical protein
MIPDNLKAITDEELLALQQRHLFSGEKHALTGRESERVWHEIVRRRELKRDPHFGQQRVEPANTKSIFDSLGKRFGIPSMGALEKNEEKASQFDPKSDISADARYLWTRIFYWFWVVPFVGGLLGLLLWLLIVMLK